MKKFFWFLLIIGFIFAGSNVYAEEDTAPPTGTIQINGGALYTNTRDVTLTLSATDDMSDVVEMKFNNGTGAYADPLPYTTTAPWTLSASGDGIKTVRVKFKDAVGNETATGIPATIILDTEIPIITLLGDTEVNLTVGDVYTDAGATVLDGETDMTGDITVNNPVDTNTAGTYTVTYNAVDLAGNNAIEVTRTVIVTADADPVFDVVVNNGCEITDTSTEVHVFPKEDSPSDFLAVCALSAAKEAGHITNFELTNSNFGLYVQSVNDIDPSSTEYWALWLNNGFAECGIGCLAVAEDDVLSFRLTDWMSETESTTINLRITELVVLDEEPEPESGGGSGSGGGGSPSPVFNTANAITYLKSMQNGDGSFGSSELYTDWAAIALAGAEVTGTERDNLLAYLNSNSSISNLLTDNERRAMTLLSLGQNPYAYNGVDYIKPIADSFDGTQFGDTNLVNDDIFALIPLADSGYTADENIIIKGVGFVISKQRIDGSWEGSVDLTAAAVQALTSWSQVTGVGEALTKAKNYLKSVQLTNGGFGDSVSSTAWAMQAMNIFGETWVNNSKSPIDYLASVQVNDGAVLAASETNDNRIWATSYALPAVLNKSWSAIMQNVAKPVVIVSSGGGGGSPVIVDSTNSPLVNSLHFTVNNEPEPAVEELVVIESENTEEIIVNKEDVEIIQTIIDNTTDTVLASTPSTPTSNIAPIENIIGKTLQENNNSLLTASVASSSGKSKSSPGVLIGGGIVLLGAGIYVGIKGKILR